MCVMYYVLCCVCVCVCIRRVMVCVHVVCDALCCLLCVLHYTLLCACGARCVIHGIFHGAHVSVCVVYHMLCVMLRVDSV